VGIREGPIKHTQEVVFNFMIMLAHSVFAHFACGWMSSEISSSKSSQSRSIGDFNPISQCIQ